jgi:hypothetical protein
MYKNAQENRYLADFAFFEMQKWYNIAKFDIKIGSPAIHGK